MRFEFYFPWQHRTLLWQFSRREILGKYRDSVLGLAWSLLTPLLMLAVYSLVFIGIFRARWPVGEDAGHADFALQIFAGLIVFQCFAEVASRAPRLILDQANLVKKVIFPLEILSWVSVVSAFFQAVLSLLILMLANVILNGQLFVTLWYVPLIFLSFLPFLLGISWLGAALGVFLRDLSQLMQLAVSLLMFLSPVFYSLYALSAAWQRVLLWNPLTVWIESLRAVVLLGQAPNLWVLSVVFVWSLLFSVLSLWFFVRTRPSFADVL